MYNHCEHCECLVCAAQIQEILDTEWERAPMLGAPPRTRSFDPDHESLVARFDQLSRIIQLARDGAGVATLMDDAQILLGLIRRQVVK